jgi:hypothetical protein
MATSTEVGFVEMRLAKEVSLAVSPGFPVRRAGWVSQDRKLPI